VVKIFYDSLGRRDHAVDPAAESTHFGYDAVGRLTSVTDALEGATGYDYDGRGNRQTVTDANHHTTQFVYDRANRLLQEQAPISTATDFTYNAAAGNLSTKVDGNDRPRRSSTTPTGV
jgi:YD repeat-containing protein